MPSWWRPERCGYSQLTCSHCWLDSAPLLTPRCWMSTLSPWDWLEWGSPCSSYLISFCHIVLQGLPIQSCFSWRYSYSEILLYTKTFSQCILSVCRGYKQCFCPLTHLIKAHQSLKSKYFDCFTIETLSIPYAYLKVFPLILLQHR